LVVTDEAGWRLQQLSIKSTRPADCSNLIVRAPADVFITSRPYLFESKWRPGSLLICPPAEALAFIGLYLRTQDEYVVSLASHPDAFLRFGRSLYYWGVPPPRRGQ
jgi:hypothetical protein